MGLIFGVSHGLTWTWQHVSKGRTHLVSTPWWNFIKLSQNLQPQHIVVHLLFYISPDNLGYRHIGGAGGILKWAMLTVLLVSDKPDLIPWRQQQFAEIISLGVQYFVITTIY